MKRMKSKLHGFTHAVDGNEEAYLRKLGWIEESESFPSETEAPVEAVVETHAQEEKAPKARRKKKEKA